MTPLALQSVTMSVCVEDENVRLNLAVKSCFPESPSPALTAVTAWCLQDFSGKYTTIQKFGVSKI